MKEEKKINWPLIGNEPVLNFLYKSINNNKIAGSYIFLGPEDLGKTTLAQYFAQSLLCKNKEKKEVKLPCGQCAACLQFKKKDREEINGTHLQTPSSTDEADRQEGNKNIVHGDFHLIKKEAGKKNILIEQIRKFINILGLSSFQGSYKIGIIKEADSLSLEAANALLKTLEEPKAKVVIILITTNLESIPATIASRSQVLNFYSVKIDTIYDYLIKERGLTRSQAKNLARLSLGRPARAIKFLEDKNFYQDYLNTTNSFINFLNQDINERIESLNNINQDSAEQIIKDWQGLMRDLLLINSDHQELIQHEIIKEEILNFKDRISLKKIIDIIKVLKISQLYLKSNVNSKLVFENIAINI